MLTLQIPKYDPVGTTGRQNKVTQQPFKSCSKDLLLKLEVAVVLVTQTMHQLMHDIS